MTPFAPKTITEEFCFSAILVGRGSRDRKTFAFSRDCVHCMCIYVCAQIARRIWGGGFKIERIYRILTIYDRKTMLKLARPFATLQHPSSFTAAVIFQKKKRKSLRAAKGSDVVCVYGFENKENCQPFSLRLAIVAFSNDTTASPPSWGGGLEVISKG